MAEEGQTQSGTRPRGGRRAEGLSRALEEYAGELGYSVRALKGWLAIGRAAVPPDPCPLDDVGQLPAWWSRHMKQNVPARIVAAAAKAGAGTVVAGLPLFNPAREVAAPVLEKAGEVEKPKELEDAEVGLAASLERIRKAEATASKAYLEAVEQKLDGGVIEQRQRAWERTLEALRKIEKDGAELLRSSGETVRRHELRAVLVPMHRAIASSLRSFFRRVRPKLEGLNPTEQDKVWSVEVEQLFRRMRDCAFTGGADV